MRKILLFALFGALLVGCGPKGGSEEGEGAAVDAVVTVDMATATTRSVRDLLPIDGSYVLATNDFAKLAPQTSGRLLDVYVKEGDAIKQGQLLAKIDTSVQDAERSSAVSGSAAADAQAKQSQASFQAAKAEYEATVRAAKLNLETTVTEENSSVDQAKVDLDRIRAGARPQEIAQAEQAVRQAKVTRDKAKIDADRDQKLLKDGLVSGQQADASKAAFEVAESALTQAKSQLDLLKAGARPEELKAAELRYQSAVDLRKKRIDLAKANLEQAQKASLGVDAKRQEALATALAAQGKRSDSSAAAGMAAYGDIRAPFDGVVTRKLLGKGASVDSTTPVLEVARKNASVEFLGQTSPRNSTKIREGMSVLIEGTDDEAGIVRSVGVADPQSGQVPIRIVFNHPPAHVSAGLYARVNIVQRHVSNAIVIPDGAIVTRDDKKVAFVVEGAEAKMREIDLGPSEGGFTAVEKGIKPGEKVVIVGQHELSDGAKVQDAAAQPDEKAAPAGDKKPAMQGDGD